MERQLPDDLSYEGWVKYIFDHPILEPRWWWQDEEGEDFQWWNEEADTARTLAYVTQMFRESATLVGRFSRAQIDQGLSYIVDPSSSLHLFVLIDQSLPWDDRRECFQAMVPLYRDLMAPIYGNDLGHTQFGPGDSARPNYACYMWWDVMPLHGAMNHPDQERINDAVFTIFEEVLALEAESCLESVLHGLGHWQRYAPRRADGAVERFLQRQDISYSLRTYATLAREGGVN